MAFVQSWTSTSATNTQTTNFSLSGVAANNLLVMNVNIWRSLATTITVPSGWTLLVDNTGTGPDTSSVVCYKIADGTESAENLTWSNNAQHSAVIAEFSGLDATSPLEDWGIGAGSSSSGGAPISCGTATPITANGKAIALFGGRESTADSAELSVDSGYTRDVFAYGGGNPTAALASLDYSTTTAQSPSWDTSRGNTWTAFTAIAVFKAAGGGGGTTVEASVSYGVDFSASPSSDATAEASTASAVVLTYETNGGQISEATMTSALQLGDGYNAALVVSAAIQEVVFLDESTGADATAEGAHAAPVGLSDFVTGQAETAGEVEGVVTFGLDMNAQATADAQTVASIVAAIGLATQATAETGIDVATVQGMNLATQATAEISIEAGVQMDTQLAANMIAEAQAEAALVMNMGLATQVVAEALTQAGVAFAQVNDVSFVGSVITANYTTPDGRVFTVTADVRAFTVDFQSRTFTVPQE